MGTKRLPTEERRTQLADAALTLLSTEGARALTVKRIAEHVGITDGAVFRHFDDKASLFRAAVARFESQLTPLPDEGRPAVERLGAFFIERTRAVQARPEILGLALNDRLQEVVGEEGAARIQQQMQSSFAFLSRAVQQAQAENRIGSDVDVRTVAWMITGAMRGAARSGVDPKEAWSSVCAALFSDPTPRSAS